MRSRAVLNVPLMAIVLLSAFAWQPATTRANGVPQLVKLSYLQGVSNFGPKDAEGVLEFSFAEAYARVDVKGLKPEAGYTYEGWLLAPGGDSLKVGVITLAPSGIGVLDARLEKLKSYDYRSFVVAARGPSAPGTGIPSERSIAGVFEVLGAEAGASARGDVRPGVLPDTGERPPLTTMERVARTIVALAAMTAVSVVALVIIRRRHSS